MIPEAEVPQAPKRGMTRSSRLILRPKILGMKPKMFGFDSPAAFVLVVSCSCLLNCGFSVPLGRFAF